MGSLEYVADGRLRLNNGNALARCCKVNVVSLSLCIRPRYRSAGGILSPPYLNVRKHITKSLRTIAACCRVRPVAVTQNRPRITLLLADVTVTAHESRDVPARITNGNNTGILHAVERRCRRRSNIPRKTKISVPFRIVILSRLCVTSFCRRVLSRKKKRKVSVRGHGS